MIIAFALALPVIAGAQVQRTVDLREPGALHALQESNPAHFEKIHRALVALDERPERAEGGWLQTNIDARDVDLSELLLKTSYPPKQLLRFTLEDTRYLLHLVRSDIAPEYTPAM